MLKISLRCNATPRLKLYFVLDLFWCSKEMISEHSAGPSISSSLTRTRFFCCARMCSALWVRITYVYFFPGRTRGHVLYTKHGLRIFFSFYDERTCADNGLITQVRPVKNINQSSMTRTHNALHIRAQQQNRF